jgi:hypothetical protein
MHSSQAHRLPAPEAASRVQYLTESVSATTMQLPARVYLFRKRCAPAEKRVNVLFIGESRGGAHRREGDWQWEPIVPASKPSCPCLRLTPFHRGVAVYDWPAGWLTTPCHAILYHTARRYCMYNLRATNLLCHRVTALNSSPVTPPFIFLSRSPMAAVAASVRSMVSYLARFSLRLGEGSSCLGLFVLLSFSHAER